MNKYIKASFFIFFITSEAFSNGLKFTMERPIPFIGGSDYNKDNLQKTGIIKIEQFAGYYYLGEVLGLYFGLVSNKERAEYKQYETSTRPYGRFSSNYFNVGPEFGVWIQLSDKARLEAGVALSQGNLEFSDEVASILTQSNTKRIDLHASYAYPFVIVDQSLSLDLFFKLGYYKVFLSEFTYNGVTYSGSELNLKEYLYYSIGFGIRF